MKTKVSIVEDHNQTADELSKIICQSMEFEFLEWYSSGERALEGIPSQLPDLVIMDIGLPGIDGIETIRRLRENLPDLKIIVLTVFEDEKKILRSIEAGANGYLLKDTEASLLLAELKVMCLGGAPMSPAIALKIINTFHIDGTAQTTAPTGAEPDLVEMLTKRELEVLNLISIGYMYSDIATDLNISPHTVRRHIEKIYKKLNVHSRFEAIKRGRNIGLIET